MSRDLARQGRKLFVDALNNNSQDYNNNSQDYNNDNSQNVNKTIECIDDLIDYQTGSKTEEEVKDSIDYLSNCSSDDISDAVDEIIKDTGYNLEKLKSLVVNEELIALMESIMDPNITRDEYIKKMGTISNYSKSDLKNVVKYGMENLNWKPDDIIKSSEKF